MSNGIAYGEGGIKDMRSILPKSTHIFVGFSVSVIFIELIIYQGKERVSNFYCLISFKQCW